MAEATLDKDWHAAWQRVHTPAAAAPPPTDPAAGDNFDVGDYVADAGKGVLAGTEGFFKGLGKLGDDLVETLGGDLVSDDSIWENQIKTKTWAGGLTDGVTQFLWGFVPVMGVVGKVGKIAQVGKLGKAGLAMAAGGITDFVAYQEHEERLSNLVQQHPALANPITEYLAADKDDGWVEGRFKNALEGLGLGVMVDATFKAVRGMKGMAAAKIAKDQAAFQKAADEAASSVGETLKKTEAGDDAATAAPDAKAPKGKMPKVEPGKRPIDSVSAPDDIVKKIKDHVTNSGRPLEESIEDAVKTHLNLARLDTPDKVKDALIAVVRAGDELVQSKVGGVQSLASVKEAAEELAGKMGLNPELFAKVATDEANIAGMGTRLVTYRIARNSLGEELTNLARRLDGGEGVGDAAAPAAVNYAEAVEAAGIKTLSGPWSKGAKVPLAEVPPEKLQKAYEKLVELGKIKPAAVASEGDNVPLLNRIGDLSKLFVNLHTSLQVIQTEGARIPSFGRVLAGTRELDYDKMYTVLRDTLSGQQGGKAKAKLLKALVAADGDAKAVDGVLEFFGGAGRKALSIHNEFWVNMILSGTKTNMTNLLSNLTQTFLMPAERMVGGMFALDGEMVKSGGRMYMNLVASALDILNLGNISAKMNEGAGGSSLGRAWSTLWNEQPIIDTLKKTEGGPAFTSANLGLDGKPFAWAFDYVGKIIRMPTRLLTGADELFKQVNYRAYLREQAFREASARGLAGDEIARFVTDRVRHGGFDSAGRATNTMALSYARQATFTEELLNGTLGASMQQMVLKHPGLRLFAPFIKTPTNIFRRFVQYTPGLNHLQGEYRRMYNSADPVERASARGRMALGGMLWGVATATAASGKITGGGPSNKGERDALLATGWRPYSLVFKGDDGTKRYYEFRRLDPFAMVLGMAGDFAEMSGSLEDGDNDGLASALTMALAKNLTSKTYLTGLTEIVNVLSQPDRHAERWVRARVASYVPNLSSSVNDDEYLRDARSVMDAVRRKIPGLSDDLPPRRNLLGEAINAPAGWAPFGMEGTHAARMLSPVGYSKQVSDPVKEEIAKLSHGFRLPAAKYKGLTLSEFKNAAGRDAYDYLQERTGQTKLGGKTLAQALEKLIASPRYQSLPPPGGRDDQTNERVREVQRVLADYRDRAMSETLKEFPQISLNLRELERSRHTHPLLQKLAG